MGQQKHTTRQPSRIFMEQLPDKKKGVWVTPKEFFEPLRVEFDLKIDAAASPDNAMLPVFFCEGIRDAFDQDWSNQRIWCNPPYGGRGKGGMYDWVKRCATGGSEVVVALLPARTDTRWFHDFIWQKANSEIRFIKGRIHFSGAPDSGKFPSMVVIFRKTS